MTCYQMQTLNLMKNRLQSLPKFLTYHPNLKKIEVRNNPISQSILPKTLSLSELASIFSEDLVEWPRFQCCVMGEGSVGKTSLLRMISNSSSSPLGGSLSYTFKACSGQTVCCTFRELEGNLIDHGLFTLFINNYSPLLVLHDVTDEGSLFRLSHLFSRLRRSSLKPRIFVVGVLLSSNFSCDESILARDAQVSFPFFPFSFI